MPRFPNWVWLLLAIAFAFLSSILALGWLKRQAAIQAPPREKTSLVVVAAADVGPAIQLAASQLKMATWHLETPPPAPFATSMRWRVASRQLP